MNKRKVNIHDIKQALMDQRFRESLPEDLSSDVQKFLKNPGCGCNHPIYMNIMRKASKEIAQYFPSKETLTEEEAKVEFDKITRNEWQVINCSAKELGAELRKLGAGRKQISMARYEDQVTVIVNHMEEVF